MSSTAVPHAVPHTRGRPVPAWHADVRARAAELQARLNAVHDVAPPHASALRAAAQQAIDDAVHGLDRDARRRRLVTRVSSWWTGEANTAAWQDVHDAENLVLALESDERVRAQATYLRARLTEVLPARSVQRRGFDDRLRAMAKPGAAIDHDELRGIHAFVCRASDNWHADLRRFRNKLVSLAGAVALLLLVLGVLQAIDRDVLALCTSGDTRTCLQGTAPAGGDVLLVFVLGAIGGLIGGVVPLSGLRTVPSRFSVRGAQIALKAVVGAFTAWLGVVLVLSGVLDVTVSSTNLVAYAVLFGYAQQLMTRYVDRHVADVLGRGGTSEDDED
jgi:hypothetical protein